MSHSVDEYYTIHENRRTLARKAHVCCACKEIIPAGDYYHRVFVVFDGQIDTFKRCLRCEAIHAHLIVKGQGDAYPNEALDCGEEYEREWGSPPPDEIAKLAFVTGHELQPVSGER